MGPHQPVATRPLAIQKDGTWYTYGWDLTKNICEVYGQHGYIRTAYTYTPYGQVTAEGDVTQPIQWSSEYNDTELGLVYYNFRHYNPTDGRWIGRDKLGEETALHLYRYTLNNVLGMADSVGLSEYVLSKGSLYQQTPDPGSGRHGAQNPDLGDVLLHQQYSRMAQLALFVYPMAALHMLHYLSNSGKTKTFNVKKYAYENDFKIALEEELVALGR